VVIVITAVISGRDGGGICPSLFTVNGRLRAELDLGGAGEAVPVRVTMVAGLSSG
jgi:hypothetical protein